MWMARRKRSARCCCDGFFNKIIASFATESNDRHITALVMSVWPPIEYLFGVDDDRYFRGKTAVGVSLVAVRHGLFVVGLFGQVSGAGLHPAEQRNRRADVYC